jgi:predicted alpha/beta-fold hydrolase
VQGIVRRAAQLGWRAVALNFRSCARDPKRLNRMIPNRQPRLYHSGETDDFDFLLRSLAARDRESPLLAMGASLGGNVLLKWLGEHPGQSLVRAAVALSTPFDLSACAQHLESGIGRLYVEPFLRTLRPKAILTAERFAQAAGKIDVPAVRRSRTFAEFDDAATAPLHGFTGAQDYYRRSSSLAYLSRITTPTLCISAGDDPFSPEPVLAQAMGEASSSVDFWTPKAGGHIGFVQGTWPWSARYWAEEAAAAYLNRCLAVDRCNPQRRQGVSGSRNNSCTSERR